MNEKEENKMVEESAAEAAASAFLFRKKCTENFAKTY